MTEQPTPSPLDQTPEPPGDTQASGSRRIGLVAGAIVAGLTLWAFGFAVGALVTGDDHGGDRFSGPGSPGTFQQMPGDGGFPAPPGGGQEGAPTPDSSSGPSDDSQSDS